MVTHVHLCHCSSYSVSYSKLISEVYWKQKNRVPQKIHNISSTQYVLHLLHRLYLSSFSHINMHCFGPRESVCLVPLTGPVQSSDNFTIVRQNCIRYLEEGVSPSYSQSRLSNVAQFPRYVWQCRDESHEWGSTWCCFFKIDWTRGCTSWTRGCTRCIVWTTTLHTRSHDADQIHYFFEHSFVPRLKYFHTSIFFSLISFLI